MSSIWSGRAVRLRAPAPEDQAVFARFHENSADQRNEGIIRPPRPAGKQTRDTEDQADAELDAFQLTIETLADSIVVGGLATQDIDRRSGNFSYGLIIGQEHQRRGYGSEAITMLLTYMFGECRYHKCEVGMYEFNAASIALHQKLGFIEEGRLRDHVYSAGRFHGMVLMGMTNDEFAAKHHFYSL